MKTMIIYSGGMDSTVALYKEYKLLGEKGLTAISFNYGSKHNYQEFLRAKLNCEKLNVEHRIVDIREVSKYLKSNLLINGGNIPEGHYADEGMKKTVVPFRNGIMLSIAAGIAESKNCNTLVLGNHSGDHAIYPDCRKEFIENMGRAIESGTYVNLKIKSPFCDISKADIVKIGDSFGIEWRDTYSCYKGGDIHCGRCSTCFERREAFVLSNVSDPTEYIDNTPFTELSKMYNEEYVSKN